MESRRSASRRRRSLRARRFRRHRRGVVSTVGTLLSLLVFFALFGVFLTQYLPIWMSQNESAFTYQAQSSMEILKQYVDDQAIFASPHVYGVPFTLNSQGIPLFAQPTQGTLSFVSGGCTGGFVAFASGVKPVNLGSCVFEHLGLWSNFTGPSRQVQNLSLNSTTNYLLMNLPNRYYPGQTITFGNDAIVDAQTGGRQVMLVPSPLNITHTSANTTVTASVLTLSGPASATGTQGTKDVYTLAMGSQNYTSLGRFIKNPSTSPSSLLFNVSFQVGTRNICAWYSQVSSVLNASTLAVVGAAPPGSNTTAVATLAIYGPSGAIAFPVTPTSSICTNAPGTTYELILAVYNVNFFQAYSGVSQITFNGGGL